jgi:AcrR family transcriptional regulator
VPRAKLSPDAIVDIALSIVDTGGLASLTVTAVAEQAGVATPALYKHMRNLTELNQLVTLRVLEELTGRLTQSALGRSKDEALHALAQTFRAYVSEHPHRYATVVQAPQPDSRLSTAAGRMLDVFLAVLRGYGLEGANAIHAARALRSACHGFAVLQITGGFGLPENLDVSYDLLIQMLINGLPLARHIDTSFSSRVPLWSE